VQDNAPMSVATPLLTVAQARELVLAEAAPLETEEVALDRALGRALARDVAAAGDSPPYTGSAMDGFALRAGPARRRLRIAGESRAGHPAGVAVRDGTAIRISTGATVPEGATAVIRVEDTAEEDGHVTVAAETAPGENVRPAGEDIRAGTPILRGGARLGPAQLGVAANTGVAALPCVRRPRVTVLATGDELVAPGVPLGPGQLHDSNALTLASLARLDGAEVIARSDVPDRRDATATALERGLGESDLVVVSGGVSVGPHDHVKPALDDLGVRERFWRVALQPGKPTWFGARDGTLVLGLPGNPVSAMVTFLLFAAPALRALQGLEPLPAREHALLGEPVARNPGREQALRVRLAPGDDGRPRATPTGPQQSHLLTSMLHADALAFLAAGEGVAAAGEAIEIERLSMADATV
jgi:molybdopterin molybdotransferase